MTTDLVVGEEGDWKLVARRSSMSTKMIMGIFMLFHFLDWLLMNLSVDLVGFYGCLRDKESGESMSTFHRMYC